MTDFTDHDREQDIYPPEEPDQYIDVPAPVHQFNNSTFTTPADIIGNYLLGRYVSIPRGKHRASGLVIDYHTHRQMRQSLKLVLGTGHTATLYLPTALEVEQKEIDAQQPEQPTEQATPHLWTTTELIIMCVFAAVIGAMAFALFVW